MRFGFSPLELLLLNTVGYVRPYCAGCRSRVVTTLKKCSTVEADFQNSVNKWKHLKPETYKPQSISK
jgi:hypothetical protein